MNVSGLTPCIANSEEAKKEQYICDVAGQTVTTSSNKTFFKRIAKYQNRDIVQLINIKMHCHRLLKTDLCKNAYNAEHLVQKQF